MIARKKKKLIIISSITALVLIIIGILITLYLTTDMFKSNYSLFVKYISQNITSIEEMAKKQATGIQDAIDNQKLTTDLKTTINYTDSNNNSDNSINNAELDISGQIDKMESYNYKNIKLLYENQDIAKAEYIQDGELYGIRVDGIKQFVSGTTENLDDLEKKTGISKNNLELLTFIFNELKLSNFISFDQNEIEVLTSTYLGILEQNTDKSNFIKKSNQNITVNGNTYKTNAYSLVLNKEKFNDLIIKILETVEKDEILLGKLDVLQQELEKYNLYNKEQNLKELVIETISNKVEDIKNNNIGQEETEITVYEYQGETIKTFVKTPSESISFDINNKEHIQINYIQNLDNKVQETNMIIERKVTENSQNVLFNFIKNMDGEEEQNLEISLVQNKQEAKIDNSYNLKYNIKGNVINLKTIQNMNIVENFDSQEKISDNNNMSLDTLSQENAQKIVSIVGTNVNQKIGNILDKIKLEDINNMLKDLEILKESEIKFEEGQNEIVTEAERTRFNSQLTFFIGQEVNTDTLKQMLEVSKYCFKDVQISYEEQNNNRKDLRGFTIDIERNTSNTEKIEEITNVLDEFKNEKFTVAMSFDETTKLINKITVVNNEYLEQ